MNLTALIARTRRHLSEAGTASFSDSNITEQLNRSARTLAAQHALITKRVTVDTASGVATLPAETLSVRRVWSNAGRYALHALSAEQAPMPGEPLARSGRSDRYTHDPRNPRVLNVYPLSSTTLTVDLLTAGTDMVDGTDEPWAGRYETWHDVIAYHAADRLGTQRGATGAAMTAFAQRYAQRMDEFKGAVAMMDVDTSPMHIAGSATPRRRRGWL